MISFHLKKTPPNKLRNNDLDKNKKNQNPSSAALRNSGQITKDK